MSDASEKGPQADQQSRPQLSWDDVLSGAADLPVEAAVLAEPLISPPLEKPKRATKVKSSLEDELRAKKAEMLAEKVPAPTVAFEEPEVDPIFEMPVQKEPDVLTVSALNKSIKQMLEGEFSSIWLKGEISNFKAQSSGHFYFSLKDSKSQISAVMFRGYNAGLKFRPDDGMEVIVRARISVYEPRGNYQLMVESMEPVGAGALQKAFEQLKAKLQSEGLFDAKRKRALPALPRHIGIVTSPTGAAIRDMLNVLGRRFKGVQITLAPAKVQGVGAAQEIVAQIELLNRLTDIDVMIVGRGGGSIEDLWSFNEEIVARAIAASRIPVISAVGHEIDFTIADFVADLRAPTPSAAAELVVKNAADLASRVAERSRHLVMAQSRAIVLGKQRVEGLRRRLVDPQRRIQDAALRSDELSSRLEAAALRYFDDHRLQIELLLRKMGTPQNRIAHKKQELTRATLRLNHVAERSMTARGERLKRAFARMDGVNPFAVLKRGYAFVADGPTIVTDVAQVKVGSEIRVQFARGAVRAEIKSIENSDPIADRSKE